MENTNNYHWISFSDVMTALMVMFMFIAISYMLQVKEEQNTIDHIFQDYIGTKKELHQELDSTFEQFFQKWDGIYLDSADLSIKFQNQLVFFESGAYELPDTFQMILDDFIPKYLAVITQDKYKEKIAEIRVEGHTDDTPIQGRGNPYISNLGLSQDRTTSVMEHLIQHPTYKAYPMSKQDWLTFKLVTNGYSYGKTLDNEGAFTFESKQKIKEELSRRVEFRIVTQSEELIQEVMRRLRE